MHIAICGFGAIGSLLAAHLPHHDLTILGRGAHFDAVKETHRLKVSGLQEEQVQTQRWKFVSSPKMIGAGDIALITCKAYDVEEMLEHMRCKLKVIFSNGIFDMPQGNKKCP